MCLSELLAEGMETTRMTLAARKLRRVPLMDSHLSTQAVKFWENPRNMPFISAQQIHLKSLPSSKALCQTLGLHQQAGTLLPGDSHCQCTISPSLKSPYVFP